MIYLSVGVRQLHSNRRAILSPSQGMRNIHPAIYFASTMLDVYGHTVHSAPSD